MRRFRPLRAALLAIALFLPEAAGATKITIVNLDSAGIGLNDPTPAAPVGGNPGTTKGDQALNVFQRAADLWAAKLVSSVEIRVDAHFQALSCTTSSGVLGSAGPKSFWINFTNAPLLDTIYPQALANSLSGADIDPAASDIAMQFNGAIGGASCLAGLSWYMGLDTSAPANTISLLSVSLHEMAHGLGFLSLVSLSTGAKAAGFDDAYMLNLENHATGLLYPAMTDAQRLAASISLTNLHWTGTAVLSANASLSAGVSGGHVQMYAPNPSASGSSVSHFDTALTPSELMEPSYTSPLLELSRTVLLMKDIGWNVCGNGSVEFGEQCDDGNTSSADCCSSSCTLAPSTTVCRSSTGVCDPEERCTGESGACPADTFLSAATLCRSASGICDQAENCPGSSGDCPADQFASATTECRASAGICDAAENCTGSAASCPADGFASSATVCRTSVGACDVVETCTGSTAACPADVLASTATVCRSAAGACDAAETCSGSTATCPVDGFASSATVCRASAGIRDVSESCSGSTAACPADAFASSATVCRASAGICDVPESCTGSTITCPTNILESTATVCRSAAAVCDAVETCSGSTETCPADAFASSATACRPSAGVCDQTENCGGAGIACPPDGFVSSVTVCRAPTGVCDVAETCTGAGAACPANGFASAVTVCRASAGACDSSENCSGSAPGCPSDGLVDGGTPCATDGELCTTDQCDGSSSACQHLANTVACDNGLFCDGSDSCASGTCSVHAGNPCPGADGDANCAESCDEAADVCTAADPNGSACDDGDICSIADQCSAGTCTGQPSTEDGCTPTTTLPGETTTTTLPGTLCGDANQDGRITAADALLALKAAVGTAECSIEYCDFNGDGRLTAADALAILRVAVGQQVEPHCPEAMPFPSTTVPLTSTTLKG